MRRFLIGMLMCLGAVFGVASVGGAQTYPPEVGGIVVTLPEAAIGAPRAGGRGTGGLPFTGADGTSSLVWVGVGLTAAGGVLVAASYRRRASLGA